MDKELKQKFINVNNKKKNLYDKVYMVVKRFQDNYI